MEIFFITLQAVFALLGVGVIGFWIIGRHRVSNETLGFLSSLSIDIAVPCLVLASLIIDFSPQNNPDWWHMPLWWLGFVGVSLLLSLLCSLMAKREHRGEFAMGLFYQNALFFPLIILTGLFGPRNPYLVPLFLLVFLHPTMMFSTYSFFFPKKGNAQGMSMARLFNPVLVSTIVGMSIALIGIQIYVPQFVKTIFIMVGAMASPLFMLILGGNLYHDLMLEAGGKRNIYFREVTKFVLAKNILFPSGCPRDTDPDKTDFPRSPDPHARGSGAAGHRDSHLCRTLRGKPRPVQSVHRGKFFVFSRFHSPRPLSVQPFLPVSPVKSQGSGEKKI